MLIRQFKEIQNESVIYKNIVISNGLYLFQIGIMNDPLCLSQYIIEMFLSCQQYFMRFLNIFNVNEEGRNTVVEEAMLYVLKFFISSNWYLNKVKMLIRILKQKNAITGKKIVLYLCNYLIVNSLNIDSTIMSIIFDVTDWENALWDKERSIICIIYSKKKMTGDCEKERIKWLQYFHDYGCNCSSLSKEQFNKIYQYLHSGKIQQCCWCDQKK